MSAQWLCSNVSTNEFSCELDHLQCGDGQNGYIYHVAFSGVALALLISVLHWQKVKGKVPPGPRACPIVD
jgi:hypothetical protein